MKQKIVIGLVAAACWAWAAAPGIPELRRNGDATQLFVDGEPFLILGGELHNSSASSLDYMAPIWRRLKDLSLNTVLATVSWELLEPREGAFDFRLVDGLLAQARRNRLRLVLLWFGTWKNGRSSYAPMWVKTDLQRFPRALDKQGYNTDVISPFSENAQQADARAFAALTRHLREVDSKEHTVVMIQAENEVGMLRQSRDRSAAAQKAWEAPVPAALLRYLAGHKGRLIPELDIVWSRQGYKTEGAWADVFGDDPAGHEILMAWQLGRYIGAVAAAGKHEYPLPIYVNAWLVQNDQQVAGDYPSGGPVSRMMDVWRAAAPEIDLLAPDIYLPDFRAVCARYARSGNPLFIPEASPGPESPVNAFYAFGRHNAIGFSPFGIDGLPADHAIGPAYSLLASMAPLILKAQAAGGITGAVQSKEEVDRVELGGYRFEIRYPSRRGVKGGGLILAAGPNEFYVAGRAISIRLASPQSGITARLGEADEGKFVNGVFQPGRRLNGDETGGGGEIRLTDDGFSLQHVLLYQHPR